MVYLNMKRSIRLLNVIIITSIIQTSALIYSRIVNEFSANNLIVIDTTIYAAIIVTIYLLYISIKFKKLFT